MLFALGVKGAWAKGACRLGLSQRGLRKWPKGPELKGPGPKGPEPKGHRSIRWTDHVSTQSTIGTSEHSFKSVYKGR